MIDRISASTFICFLLSWVILSLLSACGVSQRQGVYHTVVKGQTLYTISRVYEVDEAYLARINGIADPTQLQSGEQLYIPGVSQTRPVPVTVKPAPAPEPPRPVTPVSRPEAAPVIKPPPVIPSPVKPPPVAEKPAPTKATPPTGKGRFIWPVKGPIVKNFGNGSSKGLEIAVDSGTPVASAAAGKVIYSGSGITGYGNLVIVRHDDSFFTVYGYNQRNIVEAGAFVSKGEKIAYSGKPPSGGKNRVYFEIRYGKKPVNPLTYLP